MARIRTIKPEFWESESVGRLSFGARLLFISSLNFADDEGLIRWNEAYLSSQAFVYDDLSTEQISEWMRELETEGVIFPYKAGVNNQRLGWIVSFRKHQVINRPQPSKLPPPSIQNRDFHAAIFRRDDHKCSLCGQEVAINASVNTSGSKAPSLDHIIPKSKGGSDYPSNLATAHISCNKSKKDSLPNSVNSSMNPPLTEVEGKGKEGNGEEQVGADAPPADTSPVIETLPLINGKDFEVRQSLVAELEPIYPKVDVPATVREMKGWLIGNPARRKTRTGIKRFITTWLHNEQQKAEAQ